MPANAYTATPASPSIYEGTTQLQVVAAIRHVGAGTYRNLMDMYAATDFKAELRPLAENLKALTAIYEEAAAAVAATGSTEYNDFMARRLVEMAGNIIMSYLLLTDANTDDMFTASAHIYNKIANAEVAKHAEFIRNFQARTARILQSLNLLIQEHVNLTRTVLQNMCKTVRVFYNKFTTFAKSETGS